MKKLLGIAISTLMVGSMLIGCGGSDATTTEAVSEVATTATTTAAPEVEAPVTPETETIMIEDETTADVTSEAETEVLEATTTPAA